MLNNNQSSRREFICDLASSSLKVAATSSLLPYFLPTNSNAQMFSVEEHFDFIVIGSGAGGGPVAANLAEAQKRVLLLEAGGHHTNQNYSVPVFHGLSTEDPLFSWKFFIQHFTNPDLQRLDSKFETTAKHGSGIFYPRASTLGGCTAHNALIAMYPDQSDFEYIEKMTGDSSWQAHKMRGYFQKVENNQYISRVLDPFNLKKHGYNGWLPTEQSPLKLAFDDEQMAQVLLGLLAEEGIPHEILTALITGNLKLDPNDWNSVLSKVDKKFRSKIESIYNTPKSTLNGVRSGTRERILAVNARFPDFLKIEYYSLASRILFHEGTLNVLGVEYLKGRDTYEASPLWSPSHRQMATRQKFIAKLKPHGEVILAGGAFNSPQLLMLSGIGPKEVLKNAGFLNHEIRHPLPGVGKNLQDRYEIGIVSRLKKPISNLSQCTWGEVNDPCLAEYYADPKNSIYGTNGVLVGMLKRSHPELTDPDLFIFAVPGRFDGYRTGWAKRALNPNYLSWLILKCHTANNLGRVEIRSKSPFDAPTINFKSFGDGNFQNDSDLQAVLKGVHVVRGFNENPLIKNLIENEETPGPSFTKEEDLKIFIRNEAWGHHASCTNKMGRIQDDPDSVVDSNFKVHGINNLRIVDASVFPKIPGVFIVVPIYMIAEKASEVILQDSKKNTRSS